jgi:tRNA threonylcarbamoyladenosine modification (KEOPS) complex  Pcc1 subunit
MVVDEKNWPTPKAATRIMIRKKSLTLIVQTNDISSLRAVLNTNLRLLLTWKRIVGSLG